MKIEFFELEGWEERILKDAFPEHELYFNSGKLDPLSPPEPNQADIISVFVNSRITDKMLESFPNLKLIAARSTGFDHIDLAACRAKEIKVAYVPGYGNNTVAEFAFGLILSLTRKIYRGIDQIKESGLFALDDLRGSDLCGKTIGVIGTGRIGREVIHIAKGFKMSVIAFDPFPDPNLPQSLDFSYVDLNTLLKNSDIITIHCPATPKTRHLINESNIQSIKKGAILVNTARGAIVSTDALVAALEQKILQGAALDVLEEEGETKDELNYLQNGHPQEKDLKIILENHILMRMPNVLITPHMAFDSQEALEQILTTTINNIKGFLSDTACAFVPESADPQNVR